MTGTWIAIAVLALAAFGVGLLVAREGRRVWTLLASALVFALAGYAWQGAPGLPSAPQQSTSESSPASDALISARRAFYNSEGMQPSRFVITADGYARRGRHAEAAQLLRLGVTENPKDDEAWLALALALAEHTRGVMTPPVTYAFERAQEAAPGNPAPGYFRGLVALRSGQLGEARDLWAQTLADADKDAKGREYVAQQLERLDGVIKVLGERSGAAAPAAGPTPQSPSASPPANAPASPPAQ